MVVLDYSFTSSFIYESIVEKCIMAYPFFFEFFSLLTCYQALASLVHVPLIFVFTKFEKQNSSQLTIPMPRKVLTPFFSLLTTSLIRDVYTQIQGKSAWGMTHLLPNPNASAHSLVLPIS